MHIVTKLNRHQERKEKNSLFKSHEGIYVQSHATTLEGDKQNKSET